MSDSAALAALVAKKQIIMASWINHPTTLKGETVDLIPLEKEHFAELIALAEDKRIEQLLFNKVTNRNVEPVTCGGHYRLDENGMEIR